MTKIITFLENDYNELKKHLLRGSYADEEAAFLVSGTVVTDSFVNLLVKEIIPVPDKYLITKGPAGLKIDPDFISMIIKRCRNGGLSIILAHSHPFSKNSVNFSNTDNYGESKLFPKIQDRCPESYIGSMVFGQNSFRARLWNPLINRSEEIDYSKIVGSIIRKVYFNGAENNGNSDEIFHRQILALTNKGHHILKNTKVGIVGVGGNGSQILQQLVHLGVDDILIVDFDRLEMSNHNRVVGSTYEDPKNSPPKVKIMERLAKQINIKVKIRGIKGSILHNSVAQKFRDRDVIFGCTDNMSSRVLLSRFCHQYFIPIIDTGIDIQTKNQGEIHRIGGRVSVIYPDGPCLDCLDIIDHDLLATEATDEENVVPGYIDRRNEYAASIIPFNGIVASLAAIEFVNLTTGCLNNQGKRRYLMYDGINFEIRHISMETENPCGVCQEVSGIGDLVNLPSELDK